MTEHPQTSNSFRYVRFVLEATDQLSVFLKIKNTRTNFVDFNLETYKRL